MKKIFFVLLLSITYLYAQPEFQLNRSLIQEGGYYNSEIHYFPVQDQYQVFYSFKISYAQLYFEKKEDEYKAGIKVNIEVRDSLEKYVERYSKEVKVSVTDFEKTNSKNIFLQGVINFKIPNGNYKVFSVITDLTSKRERKLPPSQLTISGTNRLLEPIIVNSSKPDCHDGISFNLLNNSSIIPFNFSNFYFLVPVSDTAIKEIAVNIFRGDTLLAFDSSSKSFSLNPRIINCNDAIVLSSDASTNAIKFFNIKNFVSNISEGPIRINVIPDNDTTKKITFNSNIAWIGKPFSLSNPEEAIKLLEIIENKDVVSDLLGQSKDYNRILNDYWRQQDPTPETAYNELMNEFYSRVDYCEANFKPISGTSGAKSDRGRIYIKYGTPDNIERYTNSNDKVVETWYYKDMKFVFIDKDGTGKYSLANGQ